MTEDNNNSTSGTYNFTTNGTSWCIDPIGDKITALTRASEWLITTNLKPTLRAIIRVATFLISSNYILDPEGDKQ